MESRFSNIIRLSNTVKQLKKTAALLQSKLSLVPKISNNTIKRRQISDCKKQEKQDTSLQVRSCINLVILCKII